MIEPVTIGRATLYCGDKISEAAIDRAGKIATPKCDDGTFQSLAGFIQEVSDAALEVVTEQGKLGMAHFCLADFILPQPLDPLVEAIEDLTGVEVSKIGVHEIRARLAKHGLEIRKVPSDGPGDLLRELREQDAEAQRWGLRTSLEQRCVERITSLTEALSNLVEALAYNDEDGLTEFADVMSDARAALTERAA